TRRLAGRVRPQHRLRQRVSAGRQQGDGAYRHAEWSDSRHPLSLPRKVQRRRRQSRGLARRGVYYRAASRHRPTTGLHSTPPPTLSPYTTLFRSELADSQVEYGLSTGYGSASVLDASRVTAHTVTLNGLTAGTLYHYRVKSKDAAGNLAVSPDAVFTTAPPPDTTPPAVSITTPAANSSVSGTITVSATATDNVSVVGVQFKLDNAN